MLRDGRYAAWFRTSRGEGTCNVHLANGRLSGGDSFFTYSGSYQTDGDRFTATLTTKRYAEGPPTVFGLDEVEIQLAGKINGATASCTGSAEQAPGVTFEATLFLGQDQSPVPGRKRAMPNLNVDKLPKGSDGRYPARNSLGRGLSRV
jgi:hypothetical protein